MAHAEASGDARRRDAARKAKAAVQAQLARHRFDRLKARAGKGRWTGPTLALPDGSRAVTGAFKMDNGWSFADYDAMRTLLADAIAEIGTR